MTLLTLGQVLAAVERHSVRRATDEYGDTLEYHLVVRWTRHPECGSDYHSRNYQSGQSECGLSAEILSPIPYHWTVNGRTADGWILQQVRSYCYLPGRPYLMAGWVVGHGSDGEVCIEASSAVCLGEIAFSRTPADGRDVLA